MTCCMKASLSRIGDASSKALPVGNDISSYASLLDVGMNASLESVGRMSCSMYQVCRTNVSMHYLEISPTIVWVLAGHTENDVYSNTHWNVQ